MGRVKVTTAVFFVAFSKGRQLRSPPMKLVRWKRFTWNLTALPPLAHQMPESLQVRPATREEEKDVTTLVFRAFTLDTTWGDTLKIFRERMELGMQAAFAREEK